MSNSVKGAEKISARIAAEAQAYADAEISKAKAQAAEASEVILKKAQNKANDIIEKANEQSSALMDNAKGNAGMREKNNLLALKVEMLDKAFSLAHEKLDNMPESEYVSAMAALLANAVNAEMPDASKALLKVSKKDALTGEKFIDAAKPLFNKKVEISLSDEYARISSGFILDCGDIEINCSAETLIASSRDKLEKQVLAVLFGE